MSVNKLVVLILCTFASAKPYDEEANLNRIRRQSENINPSNLRKADLACIDYITNSPPSVGRHIHGGTEVEQGDFPHMVALGYLKHNVIEYNCGGTLISKRYVVTAAHCMQDRDGVEPTTVKLGVIDLTDEIGENYEIESYLVHAGYNKSRKYYDIALIRLNRDVVFYGDVHPACLNTDPNDFSETGIVTGWGITDHDKDKSNVLLRANLSSVSISECDNTFTTLKERLSLPNGIAESQLCAKDLVGFSDTCPGDSGGPIQVKRQASGEFYTLYGITSFGRTCGSDNPSVYTRVYSFLDWIESNVWPTEYMSATRTTNLTKSSPNVGSVSWKLPNYSHYLVIISFIYVISKQLICVC